MQTTFQNAMGANMTVIGNLAYFSASVNERGKDVSSLRRSPAGKSAGPAGRPIFKKPLDIPENVGYVVNNLGVKYVDILSASGDANGIRPGADFHFIKRFRSNTP